MLIYKAYTDTIDFRVIKKLFGFISAFRANLPCNFFTLWPSWGNAGYVDLEVCKPRAIAGWLKQTEFGVQRYCTLHCCILFYRVINAILHLHKWRPLVACKLLLWEIPAEVEALGVCIIDVGDAKSNSFALPVGDPHFGKYLLDLSAAHDTIWSSHPFRHPRDLDWYWKRCSTMDDIEFDSSTTGCHVQYVSR